MDAFTSLLNSEIKNKKRQLEEVPLLYVKRSDLERQREKAYLEEQAREEQERQKKLLKARELSSPASSSSSSEVKSKSEESTKTEAEAETGTTDELRNLSNDEVTRRLRKKDEPIRLFGETEKQRRVRLRALELIEERSEGQRNDFMKQLEKVDEMMNHDAHHQRESTSSSGKRWLHDDVSSQLNEKTISPETLKNDPDKVCSAIYLWTKRMLYEWEIELESRPPEIKRSNQGKHQTVTQRQSKEYLRPYFKQLKHKSMEPDVLAPRLPPSNDAYLRLSIGNAPWPIVYGNIMTNILLISIHERSAREKIFASQVAHVLNDETQRKWIQCIKRLMTFSQTKYPPDDLARAIG
ncbi:Prp18 domain-containing protein [Syncephalis fuscata]|nr:Prp18 domain-containing protein [Syncephalis fuscata]